MVKRDKKKIRVVLCGNGVNIAKMNMALQGVMDPDCVPFNREELLKAWEAAVPKMGNGKVRMPIIYGTGGDIVNGAEYFHRMWERNVPNDIFIPDNLKQYPVTPEEAFKREVQGTWYEKEQESVNEKMVGWVQRYHQWLEENPPMDFDEPLDSKRIKSMIDKLSKR